MCSCQLLQSDICGVRQKHNARAAVFGQHGDSDLHVLTSQCFLGHPVCRQGEYWRLSKALIRKLQEHNARAAVLAQHGAALLPALFAQVQRLEEVESKVRVLQLVSVSIEALGDAAGPLLGSVAGALPMVSVSCLL